MSHFMNNANKSHNTGKITEKKERGKGIKDNNQIKNKQIKVVKDGEKKTVRGCRTNTQIQADKEVQCDAEMRKRRIV